MWLSLLYALVEVVTQQRLVLSCLVLMDEVMSQVLYETHSLLVN